MRIVDSVRICFGRARAATAAAQQPLQSGWYVASSRRKFVCSSNEHAPPPPPVVVVVVAGAARGDLWPSRRRSGGSADQRESRDRRQRTGTKQGHAVLVGVAAEAASSPPGLLCTALCCTKLRQQRANGSDAKHVHPRIFAWTDKFRNGGAMPCERPPICRTGSAEWVYLEIIFFRSSTLWCLVFFFLNVLNVCRVKCAL